MKPTLSRIITAASIVTGIEEALIVDVAAGQKLKVARARQIIVHLADKWKYTQSEMAGALSYKGHTSVYRALQAAGAALTTDKEFKALYGQTERLCGADSKGVLVADLDRLIISTQSQLDTLYDARRRILES